MSGLGFVTFSIMAIWTSIPIQSATIAILIGLMSPIFSPSFHCFLFFFAGASLSRLLTTVFGSDEWLAPVTSRPLDRFRCRCLRLARRHVLVSFRCHVPIAFGVGFTFTRYFLIPIGRRVIRGIRLVGGVDKGKARLGEPRARAWTLPRRMEKQCATSGWRTRSLSARRKTVETFLIRPRNGSDEYGHGISNTSSTCARYSSSRREERSLHEVHRSVSSSFASPSIHDDCAGHGRRVMLVFCASAGAMQLHVSDGVRVATHLGSPRVDRTRSDGQARVDPSHLPPSYGRLRIPLLPSLRNRTGILFPLLLRRRGRSA